MLVKGPLQFCQADDSSWRSEFEGRLNTLERLGLGTYSQINDMGAVTLHSSHIMPNCNNKLA